MDFAWPSELIELGTEAAAVGRQLAARRRYREDGWLMGHDPDAALALAERGWLGMTWPTSIGVAADPPWSGSWCSRR